MPPFKLLEELLEGGGAQQNLPSTEKLLTTGGLNAADTGVIHQNGGVLHQDELAHTLWSSELYHQAQIAASATSTSFSPGGQVFAFGVAYLGAIGGGKMVEKIGMHPLLGMMVAGFLLRFVPGVDAGANITAEVATDMRLLALTVIIARAGLGLDLAMLWKLRGLCVAVALLPPMTETLVITALSHSWLSMPWMWGAMAGSLISAAAPAVVVPALLALQEKGYGVAAGIPSLVLAVAALCDVLAIAFYSFFYNISFGSGGVIFSALQAPIELGSGVVIGLGLGFLLCFLVPRGTIQGETGLAAVGPFGPAFVRKEWREGSQQVWLRSILVLGVGLALVLGMNRIDYGGGGAMAVLVMGCTACKGWGRARTAKVQSVLGNIWLHVVQPLLFAVIGAKLDPSYFEGGVLLRATGVLVIACAIRASATIGFAMWSDLKVHESVFLACAWIPKATVQAAMGPMPLAKASISGTPEEVEWGKLVMALSALSIIITAPPGATIINLMGPKLLSRDQASTITGEQRRELANH